MIELEPHSCTVTICGNVFHYMIDAPTRELARETLISCVPFPEGSEIWWEVSDNADWKRAWQRKEVEILKWRKPPSNLR